MHGLRDKVITLLKECRFEELAALVAGKRTAIKYVRRLLYEIDELMRWRAIEGMGAVAEAMAREDPEAVRNIIRNLLWSINEESGGIGWGAPESIGEIVYRRPEQFGEYASIVISFSGEQMLRGGVLWAAGRMAQARPELVQDDVEVLTRYLEDPDPLVRGYTLRLLGIMGIKPDFNLHKALLTDPGQVPLYENSELKKITVAELAAKLL